MKASYPVKYDLKDPIVPTICDAQLFSLFECPPDRSCNCTFNLLGLICIAYDCQPTDAVKCEEDGNSWCPVDARGCAMEEGLCYNAEGHSVDMMQSQPATRHSLFTA
jgi:hypothetical protein